MTKDKKYMTTKKQSENHGLGMMISKDIAQKYNGIFFAENTGTIFWAKMAIKI